MQDSLLTHLLDAMLYFQKNKIMIVALTLKQTNCFSIFISFLGLRRGVVSCFSSCVPRLSACLKNFVVLNLVSKHTCYLFFFNQDCDY